MYFVLGVVEVDVGLEMYLKVSHLVVEAILKRVMDLAVVVDIHLPN